MSSRINLVAFDPDSEKDVAELTRQRILCGWGLENVELWRSEVRAGDKGLYWIFPKVAADFPLPLEEELGFSPEYGPHAPDPNFTPLGHISLDWEDYEREPTLTCREEGNLKMTIATFFILKSMQGRGLGSAAMDAVEALASSPAYAAKTITLNTMLAENQGSQAWNEDFLGAMFIPGQRINQHWYERRGYVLYKKQPRYEYTHPKTGVKQWISAAFMQKRL